MPARTTGLIDATAVGVDRYRGTREPVAAAAHRLDQPVLPERLEREAQAPDVDVDGALLDVDVIAPHLIEQLRARVHALGTREQEAQQPKLGRTERNRPAVDRHAMRRGIELERAGSERFLRRLGRAPPQHRLDPRLELARRERLGHVVVDPRFEAGDLVGFVGARGEHDDRQLARARVAAQLLRERESRLARQHPVEQQQGRQRLVELPLRRLRVGRPRGPRNPRRPG